MPLTYADGAYRDGDDVLTEAALTVRRDRQIDAWADELAAIARVELGAGEAVMAIEFPLPRVEAFAARFLSRVTEMVTSAYVWAAGGVERVTDAGWETVAGVVDRQQEYGRGFVAALRRGEVSPAQAAARARMYAGAAVESFERGLAALRGFDAASDDCMPGSGCTQCLAQCRCSLAYDESPDGTALLVYWRLGGEEPCPDCKAFAAEWNPRRVALGGQA